MGNTFCLTNRNRNKHTIVFFLNEMYQSNVCEFLQRFPIILLAVFITSNAISTLADRSSDVTFQFPEYDYKETSKNVWQKPN